MNRGGVDGTASGRARRDNRLLTVFATRWMYVRFPHLGTKVITSTIVLVLSDDLPCWRS
jgi:hypothetical protein